MAIIAIYSPSANKEKQAKEIKEIYKHIRETKKIQKIIMVGDFNVPKVSWIWSTETHPLNVLLPISDEPGSDLIFINNIIEEGFEQIIDVPNDRQTFLDQISQILSSAH